MSFLSASTRSQIFLPPPMAIHIIKTGKRTSKEPCKLTEPLCFQSPLLRGYPPPSAMLFDDDPGIMSEVETSSTGFRRGGKQRSSLPVVRTPSKTLERPLGNCAKFSYNMINVEIIKFIICSRTNKPVVNINPRGYYDAYLICCLFYFISNFIWLYVCLIIISKS